MSASRRDLRDVLAVSWFEHRRTRELCIGLGIELAMVDTHFRGARRYLLLSVRTIALLLRRRPRVLLVQNPSLVLAAIAVAMRPLFGYRLVADAHNEAVVPFENRHHFIDSLSRWVVRRADLTVVTNRQLAQIVSQMGGTPFVLPDRIPTAPLGGVTHLADGFQVVLIATFARDEPVGEIFEAVRDADLQLHVTGNACKLEASLALRVPSNVRFTGFLSDSDYWGLLRSADAIIDLTLKPDCLVCGAYEALAVGKPLLLSDNAASTELFADGAVFTDNSAADIRRALERVRTEQTYWRAAAERKRVELAARWQENARALTDALMAGLARNRSANG